MTKPWHPRWHTIRKTVPLSAAIRDYSGTIESTRDLNPIMTLADTNPYAPPPDKETAEPPPTGAVLCPWCGQPVHFARVYLSVSSRVQCPSCHHISTRRKRVLAPGVSEAGVILAWLFAAFAAGTYSQSVTTLLWAIVVFHPLFFLVDFQIDRRLAYLARSDSAGVTWTAKSAR